MLSRCVAVDYLKFAAVLLIILDHVIEVFVGFNYAIWLMGAVGVGLFVYVSGFLAKESNGNKPFNARRYLSCRLLKLYPLYLLASILALANSSLPLERQLSNLFLVYPLFWFVPLIIIMYCLFTLYRVNRVAFYVAIIVYVDLLLYVAVYAVNLSRYDLAATVGLYWIVLLTVFFAGVYTKRLNWKLPRFSFIETVSVYTYPIYLFQGVYIYAVKEVGVYVGLAYVGLAILAFTGLKYVKEMGEVS